MSENSVPGMRDFLDSCTVQSGPYSDEVDEPERADVPRQLTGVSEYD